ncbi:hypothetical protein [Flavobacterium sp. SORGH_AS_0622]|uniref:hypothetical protein n=1 Tax=Flavobacterium sp. SORGH_AS_0622 TaxID=3041772 RepID=UPI00277D4EFC|nr:hypothetical protein [Flavobacterium sp. SORGH_AS_0622]MDQ1166386.1 hypothetical protein [Flavobacterium sp. SORGH_AS_0622]
MVSDLFLKHVGTALHSWLNYITAVDRRYVLAENSIIYPVSEFIGTKTGTNEIWLDRNHPNLTNKRLDLRFFSMLDGLRHEVAMEFKYARSGYTEGEGEQQRILNDILRLKLFQESEPDRKSYFLMCGEQLDFLKSFQSIGWSVKIDNVGRPLPKAMGIDDIKNLGLIEPEGFYTNWFPFKQTNNKTEFHITDSKSVPQNLLDQFYIDYEKCFRSMTRAKFESTKIEVRLVYLSNLSTTEDINNLMRVGIWEISAK